MKYLLPPTVVRVDTRAVALMLSAVICFSALDTLAKYLTSYYPIAQVIWARYAGHMALIVLLLGPAHGAALFRSSRVRMQLGRAALQLAGTVCNFAALANLPLAEVRGIIFSAPLLITFFAALLLGEKVALRNWIALFAGFLGVLMIIRPEAVGSSWAALLAVGAAVCISLYQLLTRRFSDSETPLSSLFFTSLAGAVVMSLVMPVVWVAPTAAHWILMLLLGACGAAGHFALIQAFKFERISAITPYSYTQLIWTALLGFIVFNEFPDAWAIGGMAVIAGCGLYIAIDRRLYRKVSTTIVK